MSTVTARYTDAQGNPASGTVYISPAARAGHDEPQIVTEKRVWADLDAQGSISIDVVPSDDPGWLIDGEMPYLVEERLSGLPFRAYWIGVPDAGVDLADVQQVEPGVVYVPVPGPQGPPGIQGPEGPQGPPGEDFTPADADARYVNTTGDTMTGTLIVPAPTAASHVPRLARTPNPATGDLGLPGYAGSDTGWRDVKSSLLNGWTATTFAIRRQGSTVRLRWLVLNGGAASNDTLYMLPTGFSVENGMVRFITDVSGVSSAFGHVQVSASGVLNTGRTITAGRAEVSWSTADTWPTSLPGTAITQPATWT